MLRNHCAALGTKVFKTCFSHPFNYSLSKRWFICSICTGIPILVSHRYICQEKVHHAIYVFLSHKIEAKCLLCLSFMFYRSSVLKKYFFHFYIISPFWISFLKCFKSVLDRSAGFMGLVLCSKHNIWLFSLPPFQTSLHKWFKNRLLWSKSCFTMFKLKGTFTK